MYVVNGPGARGAHEARRVSVNPFRRTSNIHTTTTMIRSRREVLESPPPFPPRSRDGLTGRPLIALVSERSGRGFVIINS